MTLGSLSDVLTQEIVQLFIGGMPFMSLAASVDGNWLPFPDGI